MQLLLVFAAKILEKFQSKYFACKTFTTTTRSPCAIDVIMHRVGIDLPDKTTSVPWHA